MGCRVSRSAVEILLHIGPHKAATTSIQTALSAQEPSLHRRGWNVERFDGWPGGVHAIAHRLIAQEPDVLDRLEAWCATVSRPTVVSSENFSLLEPEHIHQLVQAWRGRTIRVVYFVRNPLYRLPSLWQEWVKHGSNETFDSFYERHVESAQTHPQVNPAAQVGPWVDALGSDRVDIHLMDHIGEPVRYFLRYYCGIRMMPWKASPRTNLSMSPVSTEVYRSLGLGVHLDQSVIDRVAFDEFCRWLIQYVETDHPEYLPSRELALDNTPLDIVEPALGALSESLTAGLTPPLFSQRRRVLQLLDPEIWSAVPNVTAKRDAVLSNL